MKSTFQVFISVVLVVALWLWQVEAVAYAENLIVFYSSALTIAGLLALSVSAVKHKEPKRPSWVRMLTRAVNIFTVIVLAANAYFFIAGLFAFVLLAFYAREKASREESVA